MAGHDVETDDESGGRKGKKKLIFVILGVLLLAGAGAGAYFGGFIGGKKSEDEKSGHEEAGKEKSGHEKPEEAKAEGHGGGEEKEGEGKEGEHKEAAIPGMPQFFPLPDFLVNLNTGSAQTSFLKASIVLEVADAEDVARIQAVQPRIVDDFTTYMRELRSSDLAGSAGLERLREELLARVNKAVAPAKVSNILFKEFIVQ